MLQSWLKVFHLIGLLTWIGGALTVAVTVLRAPGASRNVVAEALAGTAKAVIRPAMILALLAGIGAFALALDTYLKSPWMHAKVTMGVLAMGLGEALLAKARKAPEKAAPFAGAFLIFIIATLVFTFLGPIWLPTRSG